MADHYSFQEFSDAQRRIYDGAVQIHAACLEAGKQIRPFRGGRHWKKIKGREYLYQYFDRYGHGRSLGPRSRHTEELLDQFTRDRQEAAERLADRRLKMRQQARFCRAAWLPRVPRTAIRVLQRLEQHDFWGENLVVTGTAAIHAYEFAAGAFIVGPKNSEIWAASRRRLILAAAGEVSPADFLRLLRQADRSFQILPGADFRAANRDGFLVRVLSPWTSGAGAPGRPGEREPGESGNLHHLASFPKFSQVVIGTGGYPATMTVPDPRAFALHQLRLSELEGREASQQARHRSQAMAVVELVLRFLPQYHFFHADLRRFPHEVVRHAAHLAEGSDLAADLDVEY